MADIQGATVDFKIETRVKALTTRSPQMTEKTCGQSKWFNSAEETLFENFLASLKERFFKSFSR